MDTVRRIHAISFTPPDNINTTDPSEATVQDLLRLFFSILAAVAVLVIVLAALEFALSRGNPEKQSRARNAIIYAAIGLAVAVLATGIISVVVRIAG